MTCSGTGMALYHPLALFEYANTNCSETRVFCFIVLKSAVVLGQCNNFQIGLIFSKIPNPTRIPTFTSRCHTSLSQLNWVTWSVCVVTANQGWDSPDVTDVRLHWDMVTETTDAVWTSQTCATTFMTSTYTNYFLNVSRASTNTEQKCWLYRLENLPFPDATS